MEPRRQRIGRTRNTAVRLLAALCYGVVSSLTRVAILAARPLIVLALRQLVRNRTFWERGLRGAWSRKVRRVREAAVPCPSLACAHRDRIQPKPCTLRPASAHATNTYNTHRCITQRRSGLHIRRGTLTATQAQHAMRR